MLVLVFMLSALVPVDLCAAEVEIGSHVVRLDGRRCVRNDWVLEAGEVAVVMSFDKDGDFKLSNPQGVVTKCCQVFVSWLCCSNINC